MSLKTTPYQKLFWQVWKSNPLDQSLILRYIFELSGNLNSSHLETALKYYVRKIHKACNAYFFERDGIVWQASKNLSLNFEYRDLSGSTINIKEIIENNSVNFNLSTGPLYKFILTKIEKKRYLFLIAFSHIIFDGISYINFIQILENLYNNATKSWKEQNVFLSPTIRPYHKENIQFWDSFFSNNNFKQPLRFLTSTARHSNKANHQKRSFFIKTKIFTKEETATLLQAVVPFTLFHLMASAMASFIGKYNSILTQEAINIGYTVSIDDSKKGIGCFTNLNPLTVDYSPYSSPYEILLAIANTRKKIKPHQAVPFLELLNRLSTKNNNPSRSFNILINHSPGLIGIATPHLKGLKSKLMASPATEGPYDIGLIYNILNGKLHIQLNIAEQLSSKEQIEEMFINFNKTLNFFITKLNTPFLALHYYSKHSHIHGPPIHLQHPNGLSDIFKNSFKCYANKAALIFKDKFWNYKELELEVLKLQALLDIKLPKLHADLSYNIGIHLNRSQNLVFCLLTAILKKICFVPLDPNFPNRRLKYFIENANVNYILTDRDTITKSELNTICSNNTFIVIDEKNEHLDIVCTKLMEEERNLNKAQYILFTSGSTGAPKGVRISHKNLYNFILAMHERIPCREEDYLLSITSLNFDISLLELLLPLSVGASVDIAASDSISNSYALAERIKNTPTTIVQATPSTWKMLQVIDWFSNRKLKILIGGENLEEHLAAYLLAQHHDVYNMYGPTETTIWSSCVLVTTPYTISLGQPIGNTTFYILDPQKRPCPLGMPGELWIGGEGVGLGYLNNDTSEKFKSLSTGEYVYKTGDIVSYFGKKYLKFIGRNDNQIKIRGFRVDLSEITAAIKQIINCIEVVTIVRLIPEIHIVSFVQGTTNNKEENSTIEKLSTILPHYMIPQRIISLKQLPLTLHNKIDLKKLQEEDIKLLITQYGYNNTPNKQLQMVPLKHSINDDESTEQKILKILEEHFNLTLLHTNYQTPFGHFGLHSINLNKLSSIINQKFNTSIKPYEFYQHNNFIKLCGHIEKQLGDKIYSKKPSIHINLTNSTHDVSIIGISARLPGATNINYFWHNLIANINTIKLNNSSRPTLPPGLKAGFINDIDKFDASFFNISPLEATYMDPQQRLLLETSWAALEDAGYNPLSLEESKIGVYIAATNFDYYSVYRASTTPIPYTMPGLVSSMLSNRISYFFAWSGPSQTFDTACSGSLVALSKAYNDLLEGRIDYALVGSTNIILDNYTNEALTIGNFLSSQGRCATFDEEADGYVRGEGVGCVLLKRNSDAVRDKDNIYGNIISCSENHGGKAHSLTAPNPEAQKALLIHAYKDKALARRVSYIETHGTGTKLGDPIEIDALKMAWRALGIWEDKPYIGLGSVKTHIGHLEPAAGIASLLKVLLSIKHKALPGNLHFNKLNPYIAIHNSPFYIVSNNQSWESDTLRVAGISSFGFGGSNAHVVIEEALPREIDTNFTDKPFYLVCLSAKALYSLQQSQKNLAHYLANLSNKAYSLANIAYTLNSGRSHFPYRCAWIIKNIAELIDGLHQQTEAIVAVSSKEKMVETLGDYRNRDTYYCELQERRKQYLAGYDLDWELLHDHEPKLRLSLPTYPFYTKPYWFETAADSSMINKTANSLATAHAIDKSGIYCIAKINDSSVKVTIDGNHPWLAEHIINDHKMLPGVAHLSLVFSAMNKLDLLYDNLIFQNITWLQPIRSYDPLTIIIEFVKQTKGLHFYLKSLDNKQLFSRGEIIAQEKNIYGHSLKYFSEKPSYKHIYHKNELYQHFLKSGINYGAFFQGLNAIYILNEQLCYSEINIEYSFELLKTNLLDSAFQSILGLSLSSLNKAMLPFSAGQIIFTKEYFEDKKSKFYAYTIKKSSMRVDIEILNANKHKICTILDLGIRPINQVNNMTKVNIEKKQTEFLSNLTYTPKWDESPIESSLNVSPKKYIIIYTQASERIAQACYNLIRYNHDAILTPFVSEHSLITVEELISSSPALKEIWIIDASPIDTLNHKDCYKKCYLFIELLKKISRYSDLSIKLITNNAIHINEYSPTIQPQNSTLLGIAQTAAKEFPHLNICCISTNHITIAHLHLIIAEKNQNNTTIQPIVLLNGKRYVRKLVASILKPLTQTKFRKKGCYLIIGGLGGLGFTLSQYLAKHYQAQLVLVGRSVADQEKVELLSKLGGNIIYEQLDLLDIQEIERILQQYQFHGIIHSALVLKDKTIPFMDKETLYEVLNPKIHGSINLFRSLLKYNIHLDFFLFFSSIQSFIANKGQANYTAACVFKDAIASLMRNFYMYETKVINWGYWGSVGIVSKKNYRERMLTMGIGSIEPEEGLKIIEDFLASDCTQIAVLKATSEALKRLDVYYDVSNTSTHHLHSDYTSKNALIKNDTIIDLITCNSEEFLKKIVPLYHNSGEEILSHKKAQQALENYSRYAVQNAKIPQENILEKYNRLKIAIRSIEKGKYIDKSQLLHEYPWLHPHIKLLDHCLSYYPEVLTGKVDPMSVLFPDGSFRLVEPIYRDNPIADYFNQIVGQIVQNYIQILPQRPFNIIEIGAGTGSTTKFVLPLLDTNVKYCFTDLSIAFLKKAQTEFEKYKNITYQICNIEKTPGEDLQNKFDLLIATNVLHATSNIKKTLQNVRKFLKEGGITIINEVTSRQDYATLTFGLTPGWWLFEDFRITNSPLIESGMWQKLLKAEGFKTVYSHGEESQQVIVALAAEQRFSIPSNIEIAFNQYTPAREKHLVDNITSNNIDVKKELDEKIIFNNLKKFITSNISKIMQIPLEEIKIDVPFTSLGIDSLIVLELLKPFKEKFGYLPSTLFFEYPTTRKLTNYLLQDYKEMCYKDFNISFNSSLSKINEGNNHIAINSSIRKWLKQTIAKTIRLDPVEIKDDIPFSNYGIDSLITLEILKPLSKQLGYMPSTIFFEYPTIQTVTQYILENHKTQALTLVNSKNFLEDIHKKKEADSNNFNLTTNQPIIEDGIAIIGIAGKFPKADNCERFWENISSGLNCIEKIPIERWDYKNFYDENGTVGKIYTKYGGFIKDIDRFDHTFFNITPYDAENMDPQERLFLQTTYHAIENAGYPLSKLTNKDIGVFVGVMNAGYSWLGVDAPDINWADALYWSIANRVSYSFDWTGPSLAVDTACSSSLTAAHLACKALKAHECSLAIVGGVNLIIHPKQYTKLCRLRMLSKGDKCRSFGKNADGFIDGEGIAAVVLKRYAEAIKDEDFIYGIIRGSSINSGGKSNGYTAPNPNAQAALIKSTLNKAAIESESISYIEAHGTGTELGDPVEIRGLTKAFDTNKKQICALGSVKSNIGHLESAAGIAGLIKVLLQLKNNHIAPSLHAAIENPYLTIQNTPFFITKDLVEWKGKHAQPRRTMVNSFGAGGANANILIEENCLYPTNISNKNLPIYIIPISANSISALQGNIDELRVWLKKQQKVDLYALAYTLGCCREHYRFRACYIVKDMNQLVMNLSNSLPENQEIIQEDAIIDAYSVLLTKLNGTNFTALDVNQLKNLFEDTKYYYLQGEDILWLDIYKVKKLAFPPGYCFDKNRHWIQNAKYGLTTSQKYLAHHKINQEEILPATFALALITSKYPEYNSFKDIHWIQPINKPIEEINVLLKGDTFTLQHMDFTYVKGCVARESVVPFKVSIKDLLGDTKLNLLESDDIYAYYNQLGYNYGDIYKNLRWLKYNEKVAIGIINNYNLKMFSIEPSMLDAGLQLAIVPLSLVQFIKKEEEIALPCYLENMIIHNTKLDNIVYCYWILNSFSENKREINYDLYFVNSYNEPFISCQGMISKVIKKTAIMFKNQDNNNINHTVNNTNIKIYPFK
ncbi:Polyketide synthase PksJ [Candidatus Cardinium hertigii]|uniref:Polyketide synthase PksJ n=2 Tax=Candidatus Cardinium hertigii TaxID=247481 RepID=A0A2Z3L7Y4_9BACT|nr:Polyketide synthase PksJ [Candidatus Cardinium hertigii]